MNIVNLDNSLRGYSHGVRDDDGSIPRYKIRGR